MRSVNLIINCSNNRVEANGRFSFDVGVKREFRLGPEDEAVRGATKVEHAYLVTLLDRLSWVNCNLATRNFGHSDGDETHQADGGVVCLDKDERTGCCLGDETLRVVGTGRVETHKRVLGVIRAGNENGVVDHAVYGTVPAVVLGGAEERLEDGPTNKQGRVLVVIEEMGKGVRLAFNPELIYLLNIGSFGVERGFACAIDDFVVVGEDDGTNAGSELASKEVIP